MNIIAVRTLRQFWHRHPQAEIPLRVLYNRLTAEQWKDPQAIPIDLICAYMHETGLKRSDFASVIGSTSRASEFLNKKRPLTISAIQKIHKAWRLSANLLIQPYHLEKGKYTTPR